MRTKFGRSTNFLHGPAKKLTSWHLPQVISKEMPADQTASIVAAGAAEFIDEDAEGTAQLLVDTLHQVRCGAVAADVYVLHAEFLLEVGNGLLFDESPDHSSCTSGLRNE